MIVAYFWTIKPSRIANAIYAMGFDRFFLMADKNVFFHKSLGTGKGETFTPSDANALQWGLVAVVSDIEKFDCSSTITTYQESFKLKNISEAFSIWSDVRKNCSKQSEIVYTDGIQILQYKNL